MDKTKQTPSVASGALVRPLPKSGVADCPSCGCKQTVKRHNADWTCYKCWFHETVDEDKEMEREITDMLMECVDWLGRNPAIKPDPRVWQHLAVYWPNDQRQATASTQP